MSRDEGPVRDMLQGIELIKEHGPADAAALHADVVVQAATLNWLRIIGEAASRVAPEVKAPHPDVPWEEVLGFRNLVRAYDQVELDQVWHFLERDLSKLETEVRAMLAELE